jgi:hypothetical protein
VKFGSDVNVMLHFASDMGKIRYTICAQKCVERNSSLGA